MSNSKHVRLAKPIKHSKASFFQNAAVVGIVAGLLVPGQAYAGGAPLVLERSVIIPNVPVGPYSDSVFVDVGGKRIFATPQAAKAVAVLDLVDGHLLKMLPMGNPHGLYYSQQLNRLFVTDGAGDVKIFNGSDYSLIKTVPLTVGADGLAFDAVTKRIYINNGGEDAKQERAIITAIDTVTMQKVAEIPVATASLEGTVVDPQKHFLYAETNEADNEIAVIDLEKNEVVSTWKLPSGRHRAKALAIDSENSRLYVACRDSDQHGTLFVLDLKNGHSVASISTGGWVDGVSIDKKRSRLYLSTGIGYVETYELGSHDNLVRGQSTETALLAKTSEFVEDLDRLYVSVPHLGDDGKAAVMIFKPVP